MNSQFVRPRELLEGSLYHECSVEELHSFLFSKIVKGLMRRVLAEIHHLLRSLIITIVIGIDREHGL
jgi:hypothetical protein